MGRVQDQVAIVTGGASGIGYATALKLAKEGAKIVIGDFNQHGAEQTAKEIKLNGGEAFGLFMDAAKEDSIKNLIDFTVESFGKIDILFNNVGSTDLNKDLDVVNLDLDEWDRLMDVNVKSIVIGCKYAVPHLIKSGGGSIINTASMAGFTGDSIRTAYGSSKAAVVNLTRYIAAQYGKYSIRCNAVAPGLILTPASERNLPPDILELFLKHNALSYHGKPDDIANAVLFLASNESKFITGQTLQIEGGHYISNPTMPDFNAFTSE
ncbi:NAD(P)-dependent dehydrogenase, short-chain alcohol dehydrogenase family [Mesobacillus persicus]|uniref:NAD(P)-dependent dehydrogenase, short-chain alcohol dehydrogenase family n=1 Tax=Mesobacillus persicus TaxID=930146 RepID=A0A1H8DBR7_9BACI|nr:SDR family oxidoreductase [Mesobacillus persicus]SEN04821.1 NAD(P)-dependent dehydrogenase, short-chain alcohol dehydrogenase family [Mesobacillus persicus]